MRREAAAVTSGLSQGDGDADSWKDARQSEAFDKRSA